MLVWVCGSVGPAAAKPMVAFEPPSPPEEAGGAFSLAVELLLPGRSEKALERAQLVRSAAGRAELVGAAALGGMPVDPECGTEPEQRLQRRVELWPARQWSQEQAGPRLQLERELRSRRGVELASESRRSEQRPGLELEPKREPGIVAGSAAEPSSGAAELLPGWEQNSGPLRQLERRPSPWLRPGIVLGLGQNLELAPKRKLEAGVGREGQSLSAPALGLERDGEPAARAQS